jgi:uncharacterized protein YpmS
MIRNFKVLLLVALILASFSCSIFVGGPDYPEETIPVSLEATESLKKQIEEAVAAGTETGTITLEINEEQLTSFVAIKLETQQDPFLLDPQIYLRDGQMKIYGKVKKGYFNANVLISLLARVDENGKPKFEISSADFGPFPAPDGLKQSLTAIITEAYTGSLGPVASGFRLETIAIADGAMTITGRIK